MVLAKVDFNSDYSDGTKYNKVSISESPSSHQNANILNITMNRDDQELIGKTNLMDREYHLGVWFLSTPRGSHFECVDNGEI